MSHEDRCIARGAWAPPEQERARFGLIFALDEQLAEGRVTLVCRRVGHDHFGVACERQPPGLLALVVQRDAADFDIVIRGHRDLQRQRNLVVGALEFRLMRIETHFARRWRHPRRLMRGGPQPPARTVLHVEPRAPVIARGIGLPAGQRDVAPAALAGAGCGYQHAVGSVRQAVDSGHGRVHVDRPGRGDHRRN